MIWRVLQELCVWPAWPLTAHNQQHHGLWGVSPQRWVHQFIINHEHTLQSLILIYMRSFQKIAANISIVYIIMFIFITNRHQTVRVRIFNVKVNKICLPFINWKIITNFIIYKFANSVYFSCIFFPKWTVFIIPYGCTLYRFLYSYCDSFQLIN